MTHTPATDRICGAWVPHDRNNPGWHRADMKPRHVCHLNPHPHSPRHQTANAAWTWNTGDTLANPTGHTRQPPQPRTSQTHHTP